MTVIPPQREAVDRLWRSKLFDGPSLVFRYAELPREYFRVGSWALASVVDADVGSGFAFAGGALGEEGDQAASLVVIGTAARNDLVGEIAGVDRI